MIKIENKKNCTGCYACFNICAEKCISMVTDNEGFWYPVVDNDRCTGCNLCEDVCPIINNIEYDNMPIAYACINKDLFTRLESSSGGIFTLIGEQIIARGGIVFGAKFDDDFNVVHDYVKTKEELKVLRGSKYLQSRIGETFVETEKYLKKGRTVLFSGTPCQIAGLNSFLRKTYDTLFTIDIICHGVPSPKVWQKYIKYQEKVAGSKAKIISFRRKDGGWKQYSISIVFENGKEYMQLYKRDLYMRAFLRNICLRPSCYSCHFKTLNRESDITMADFWGIQNILPGMDDDKGTSLIFVNSEKGQKIFKEIKDKMTFYKVNINEAVLYNSAAVKSVEYNPRREIFFSELDDLLFDKLVNKYCADPISVILKRNIKSMLKILLTKFELYKMRN